MNKALGAVIAGLILTGGLFYALQGGLFAYIPDSTGLKTIYISGTPVKANVADTPEEQRKGLGGRTPLAPTEAMLFVFDRDDHYGIWMKDMRFPIDILWLDASGTIVTIKSNVGPETYPEVYFPKQAARYVIELSAGFVEQYNVAEGQQVAL